MQKLVIFSLLILFLLLSGCGRVTTITERIEDPQPIIISTNITFQVNGIIPGDQKNPDTCLLSNGNTLIVYINEKDSTIRATIFNGYAKMASDIILPIYKPWIDGKPSLLPTQDSFYIAWESYDGVYLRRYGNDLRLIENETRILNENQDDPKLTFINSNLAVVYEEDGADGGGPKSKGVFLKIFTN